MNILKQMKDELTKRSDKEISEFISPARINLIGEHIDYVGGLVCPAAIDLYIRAYASPSNNIEIKSMNFGDEWSVINNINFNEKYDPKNSFLNYVYGTLIELKKVFNDKINENTGFKLILTSSIPVASGLSSSAAFGMLLIKVICKLYNIDLNRIEMAKLFQRVENNFIGLKSGIMDQFSIGLGKKDHFIKLNTSTLHYEYVKAGQEDYRFILLSTNKPRELAESSYNERVNELMEVSKKINIEFKELSKARTTDIEKIIDPKLKRRLNHVVSEVDRVNKITSNLKNMKGAELGKIINECHASLSKDYEVSCDELDFIADNLNQLEGVFGVRMIGAGFGGCLLAIVENNFNIRDIKFNKSYKKKFGFYFDVYEFNLENGVDCIDD